ncbi:DUF3348 family protein [Rhodocyclus purpureus]|uniref:DUF3348 family protein n=1 Tax=Rhodocyclus purpureus TaxID=1067 RepID=UPI001913709B|nr:DUF3348 family protein [Rhodocyclus purpureus]MBK5915059.1 hypothetical protein [Rhodocyclus purpureus]
MTKASSPASFHSPPLIRVLAGLAVTNVAEARQSGVERMCQWLDFTDAIALFSVLNGGAATASASPDSALSPTFAALHEDLARVRAALAGSISKDAVLSPLSPVASLQTAIELPGQERSAEGASDFLAYQSAYFAQQRKMIAAIAPLRARVRAALASASPALRRLAALDAVLEQALAARQQQLLAKPPLFLAKRFAQLQREQKEESAATPAAWLGEFSKDMQSVLLAELDLRLQPVEGLLAALGKELTKR